MPLFFLQRGSKLVPPIRRARAAGRTLAALPRERKDEALAAVKRLLEERRDAVLEANEEDVRDAIEASLSESLLKRLGLGAPGKYETLLQGIDDVVRLEDPVGQVTLARKLDDGLELYRVTSPIGVILIVFEARPDAAVQIASLGLKSANAVILKGGKEAARSNEILTNIFREGLERAGVPEDAVQLVSTREEVSSLLEMDEYIDLVVPRGSNALVRYIKDHTRIPVLGHADGICSVYLHEDAEEVMACRVVVDSKTHYPAACNAMETLLVHEALVPTVLPVVGRALAAAGVTMHADERCYPHLPPEATHPATEEDFDTEFLTLTCAVKAVPSLEAAIDHINAHGSHHTDAIVTQSQEAAETFMQGVDSAGVFHNASTRFADGFRYGFGAELGISTNRIHARGPVGLEGMVIYKYRLYGSRPAAAAPSGFVAGEYSGTKESAPVRAFLHEDMPGASLPRCGE